MPKPYIRKTDRGAAYTQEKLKEVVEAVKNGEISAYAASKLHGIPRPTIVNRVYDRKGMKSKTLGRPTVLPLDVEKSLAENLHIMEKYGFGLTRKEVLEVVGQYVVQNNIETPFKDGIPGEDWFLAFKKRHNLSVKKPQPVEYARKKACSPAVIYPYFDLLEKTIDDLGLHDKPSHIWNADETSFSKDPSKSKVVGLRGYTSTRTISSPGRTNTTVLLACNAAGEKAPPLIVYKGKNVWDTWSSKDGYPGTRYAATSNGWMETSVFEKFMDKIFLPAIGDKRPILLLYDGHSTHLSIKVIQTARDNNITIIKIPPHSSDNLQPLDLAVNKSFKDKWDVALVKWQRLNVGKVLPKIEFSRIIGEVWTQIDPLVCAAGFRKAGIYPLDKNAIPEIKFDSVLLAEWKKDTTLKKTENMSEKQDTSTNQPLKECTNKDTNKKSEASTDQPVKECTNEEANKRSEGSIDEPLKKPNELKDIALALVIKMLYKEQVSPQNIAISLNKTFPVSRFDIITKRSPLKKKQLAIDILNKQSQEKDDPVKNTGKVQQCSKVQILDNQLVITNIKFEELLLKTVKPGKLSVKTTRTKVATGAEVITHDEVYERYKLIEADKQQKLKKQEEKKVQRENTKAKNSEKTNKSIPGPSGEQRKKKVHIKEDNNEKINQSVPGPSGLQQEKKIHTQEGNSEKMKNGVPGLGIKRKRKSEDEIETTLNTSINSKKGKGVGKKTRVTLTKNQKKNKMPAKKTYRKRSSSSTSVSDCMCLDDDSDIADLKDLIEEDTDPLDENFDIVRDLGVNKYTTDLENNNTIDQKKKTTDIISRSEERKEDKNTVITKIKNEVKRVRNVVGESEGRNMAVEIVIGNRTKRRNKTTEVICGLEGRKMEDEVVMGSIIQKTNEATDVTFGLERSKLEEKAIIVTGERNEKKKIGRETVCGPKGGKVKDEIVTVNIIQKKNEATDVPCGIKRGKMEETTITGTKTEENKKKKKIGDGEFVSGSEKKEMEAEGVDDNLDEKTEENIEEVNYALHDNVMVRYFSRNKWTYYIGYITAIFSNEMYEIRFYKTCKKPLKFKHTKKVDRDTVPAIYIVKKVHLLQDLSCPNEFLLSDKKDFIFFS